MDEGRVWVNSRGREHIPGRRDSLEDGALRRHAQEMWTDQSCKIAALI